MTVKEISAFENFKPVILPEPDRVVSGVYIGDLLSWVMGNAKSDDAWITIMTNLNILAVASLADTSCIILAEGVSVEEEVIKTARLKNINIISASLPIYDIAIKLSKLL